MRLLRVQVPDFRVLKNIDISFEKDFFPNIFPLASQNGGGKSTLLQLIFILLHCSGDLDKAEFIQNLLDRFDVDDETGKRTLAIFDIWDGENNIKLEFQACNYIFLKQSVNLENFNEYQIGLFESYQWKEKKEIDLLLQKISFMEQDLRTLEKSRERIEKTSNLYDHEEQRSIILEEIDKYKNLFSIRNQWVSYPLANIRSVLSPKAVYSEVLSFSRHIENEISNLKYASQPDEFCRTTIINQLLENQYFYITDYTVISDTKKEDRYFLLCCIDGIKVEQKDIFLKKLSGKIYLASPSTQVFLFFEKEKRKSLFKKNMNMRTDPNSGDFYDLSNDNDYDSGRSYAKSKLKRFFTYDFFNPDLLIDSFKESRDKDFRQAIKTGQYGNSYQVLLDNLNKVLGNKTVNIDENLTEVHFKLADDKNGQELYPEDLSHGELKRLSIYVWLKYRKIEDAIVLMDEIEIAFHPDWQYKIIDDLQEWEPSNQYILATHSYELCQALTPAHVKEIEPKLLPTKTENSL